MGDGAILRTARIARGAGYIFLRGVLQIGLTLVFFLFLARCFPAYTTGMGEFAIVGFIYTLAQIVGNLGMNWGAVRYIAYYQGKGEEEMAYAAMISSLKVVLVCSSVLSAISFAICYHIGLTPLLILLSIGVFSAPLWFFMVSIVQGLRKFGWFSGLLSINEVLRKVPAIVLLIWGYGLEGILLSWVVADFATIGLSFIPISRGFRTKEGGSLPAKELFSFSMPILGANLIEYASAWADRIALLFLFVGGNPLIALGIYTVAATANQLVIAMITRSFFMAMFPQFSETYGAKPEELSQVFALSSRYINYVSFPCAIGAALLAEPVILILGPTYVDAVSPFMLLATCIILSGPWYAVASAFLALGKSGEYLKMMATGVISDIVVCALLIPYLGICGAAIGRNVLFVTSLCWGAIRLRKYIEVKFDKESVVKGGVGATILGGVVYAVSVFFVHKLLVLLLSVLLGSLAYLASIVAQRGVHSRDVEFIEGILPPRMNWLVRLLEKVAK